MSNIIGIDYANDGKSVRLNPVEVEIDRWLEVYEEVHDCNSNGVCNRCANNNNFDREVIVIRVPRKNKTFSFVRTISHKLGSIWSNWYDNSYAITPAK